MNPVNNDPYWHGHILDPWHSPPEETLKGADDSRWTSGPSISSRDMRNRQEIGHRINIGLDVDARSDIRFGIEGPDVTFMPPPEHLGNSDGSRLYLLPTADPPLMHPRTQAVSSNRFGAPDAYFIKDSKDGIRPMNNTRNPQQRVHRQVHRNKFDSANAFQGVGETPLVYPIGVMQGEDPQLFPLGGPRLPLQQELNPNAGGLRQMEQDGVHRRLHPRGGPPNSHQSIDIRGGLYSDNVFRSMDADASGNRSRLASRAAAEMDRFYTQSTGQFHGY